MKKIILSAVFAMFGSVAALALTPASFPGGAEAQAEYISTNLQYPPMAKDHGIEGVVNVAFTVNPDGSIGNIKIIRMVDPDLEGEAIRLVKNMPRWTPAQDGANPVESTSEIAISFQLAD